MVSMNADLAKRLRQNVADFYEVHGKSFDRTRAFVWNEEKLAISKIQPGMTVVDVGAGNGRFARLLPEGVNYLGIEPSEALRAAANPNIQMRAGGFPKLDPPDQMSDTTVCFAVIQHLPTQEDRRAAVEELIRITKRRGWIIATSWHPTGRFSRQDVSVIEHGELGDVWVSWHAEGAEAQRYIHDFSFDEWRSLWNHPNLVIEHIGLFGQNDWTEDLNEGRNWCVIAQRQ